MIYSDSKYSIRCCTTYGEKLYKLNWKKNKPIPNIELVKKALLALESIYKEGYRYQKTGIILSDLNDISVYKKNLFSSINSEEKRKKLMN